MMSKETISINVPTLTKQVNDGMKKDALALHYGIPVSQMGAALKQAGLKIRKFHAPAFVLVNDEEVSANENENTDLSETLDNSPTMQEELTEEVVKEEISIWRD